MGVIVDTSVLIELERRRLGGQGSALESLRSEALIAAVTLAELEVGVELANSGRRRALRRQFADDVVRTLDVVPFGIEEARAYARLFAVLRSSGQMIGDRDLQIAATAVAGGHEILTGNEHEFSRVPGLVVRTLD